MPENPFTHRPPRSWQKITIQVAEHNADLVASYLASLTGSGVEFSSKKEIDRKQATETISAYFADDNTLSDKKNKLKKFLVNLAGQPADIPPLMQEEHIQEEDWGTSWKKHFKPVQITEHIVVKPSWEKYEAEDRQIIIEIDPGMAFGTGLHASTSMSLEFIDYCFSKKKPESILDMGTGTGILGIAGALLGARTVLGVDNDLDAIAAAKKNIIHNKVNEIMTVSNSEPQKIAGPFELITANITHDILLEIAPVLTTLLAPGADLILAGIIQGSQEKSLINSYCNLGLTMADRRHCDEWAAFRFYL